MKTLMLPEALLFYFDFYCSSLTGTAANTLDMKFPKIGV
jgi:hypothetical protein